MLKFSSLLTVVLFIASFNLSAQTGYGTDVTAIIGIPTGKNSQVYNIGFGGLASFYYDIEDNVRLALTLGFIRMSVDNEGLNKALTESGGSGTVDIDGVLRSIPVILSVRLITPGPKIRFYGMLEGGIYTYWSKATGTYFPGNGEVPIDESEFRSEPGFAAGIGILFPLKEDLNFDINVRYTFIQDSEYLNLGNSTISSSQMLMFGLGVNWFFTL